MKVNRDKLNGYYFEANQETFDALVKVGYEIMDVYEQTNIYHKFFLISENCIDIYGYRPEYRQAYCHNGEFYTDRIKEATTKEVCHEQNGKSERQDTLTLKEDDESTYAEQVDVAHGLEGKEPLVENINSNITFKEDILKLHILYLEKLEYLSKKEREAYEAYFYNLANPVYYIGGNMEDIKIKELKDA